VAEHKLELELDAKEQWQQQIQELLMLQHPLTRDGSPSGSGKPYCRISRQVDPAVQSLVVKLALDWETDEQDILLVCWQLLLARITGRSEVLTGYYREEVSHHEGMELFRTCLPLLAHVDGTACLRQAVRQAEEPHSPLSEAKIMEEKLEYSGVYPFGFHYVRDSAPALYPEDRRILNSADHQSARVILYAASQDDGLLVEVCTEEGCLNQEDGERLLEQYLMLLEQAVKHAESPVSELELLGSRERSQILNAFNDTDTPYDCRRSIQQLFEEQVERTSEAVAVIDETGRLTYRELNERANRLARTLRAEGVMADTPVGIIAERSLGMIVGIYAILKAGGAYLPLDPAYPDERIRYMLEDSGARLLLCQSSLSARVEFEGIKIELEDPAAYQEDVSNLEPINTPDHLAYVIYTSGSTGRPKGVMVEHHSVLNRILWMQDAYPLSGGDTIMQKTAVTFDVSVWELFWWSFVGAGVCLLQPGGEKDPEQILRTISRHSITTMHFVPSMLQTFLEYLQEWESDSLGQKLSTLKQVFVSGEALAASHARQFHRLVASACGAELINLYGPTEATVDVSYYRCETEDMQRPVPIGKPIANLQLYVLKEGTLQLQPIGVAGELCIAGVGLARGYLNRPELTAEKFAACPFAPGGRIYRTGDLARWLPDGNIDYLGRLDHQVKVRGFRIELGEIESLLDTHPHVKQSVVVARGDMPEGQCLVAYVKTDGNAEDEELLRYLQAYLPAFMLPSDVVQLQAFPLSFNGKINRQALPKPDRSLRIRSNAGDLPQTVLEKRLAELYSGLLGVRDVRVDERFFELGGHSLMATRFISRVWEECSVKLPVKLVLGNGTIRQLAEWITKAQVGPPAAGEAELKPVPRNGDLEPSYVQQRMWFLYSLNPNSTAYHIPVVLEFKGSLKVPALQRSIRELIARHESLRTTITDVFGQARLSICDRLDYELPVIPVEQAASSNVVTLAKELNQLPFDLRKGPLFRGALIQTEKDLHTLVWVVHHIIWDGWSSDLFKQELGSLYRTLSAGESPSWSRTELDYADYAHWQREWLEQGEMQSQLQYWKHQLGGPLPVLQLPADRMRPAVQSFRGGRVDFTVSSGLTARLRELSRDAGVTLFSTLLTAFNLLLFRYSGQEDLLVGTAAACRNRSGLENIIGFFVNTLVLRTDMSGTPSFTGLLERVNRVFLEAYEQQDVPFEALVKEIQPERSLSYSPVFQVMFVMQNTPHRLLELPGIEVRETDFDTETAKFDLTLFVKEEEGLLSLSLEYSTDLFERSTIERMSSHYCHLLEGIVDEPNALIYKLPLLGAEERDQVVHRWNDTAVDYPWQIMHEWFEANASRFPERIAVEADGAELTYAELNSRADRLAHYLRGQGIGPDMFVGLCVERSVEMLVGLLGTLKAGGAYVPLDPSYPKDRLAYLLSDSQVSVVLTQERLEAGLPAGDYRTTCLDRDWERIESTPEHPVKRRVLPEDLAYMIYTSGSTGAPKGTMIPHKGLLNYLAWAVDYLEVEKGTGAVVSTSLSFDATITSMYAALLTGGRTILLKEGDETGQLCSILQTRSNLSLLKITPAHLQLLNQQLAPAELEGRVRAIVIGGEALQGDSIAMWRSKAPGTRIINEYGPTETVVGCTVYDAKTACWGPVPIGQPIANMQNYVLDAWMQPVPIGVPGELYIGGIALARGYYNRAELTAERFVPHPFDDEPGARLYKTGDMVRYLPDGNLDYIGRTDHQVKLRGYRIELGEIETALISHTAVAEAAAIMREDAPGDKRLAAYIVPAAGLTADDRAIKHYLLEKLPHYMVPSDIVVMDSLPLTPNGKVDRRLLPSPRTVTVREEGLQTDTPMEKHLARLFAEIIGVDKISVSDSFFELGGHSLLLMQLVSRIRDAWEVEIPLTVVFEAPTVAGLALRIRERLLQSDANNAARPMEAATQAAAPFEAQANPSVRSSTHIPVSLTQHGLWLFDQLNGPSPLYNIVQPVRLSGELDVSVLESALCGIVRRHDILRTSFAEVEGEAVQLISQENRFQLQVIDISEHVPRSVEDRAVQYHLQRLNNRVFDIKEDMLFEACLLVLGRHDHLLVLSMHHIISDGWSIQVLLKELAQLYSLTASGQPAALPGLAMQYADYAKQQYESTQEQKLRRQLDYWRGRMAGAPLLLQLPCDSARPERQSYEGAVMHFDLPEEACDSLRKLCVHEGATLFMALLALYSTMLSRASGQEDVVVGFPLAGRNRSETEDMIGYFVNTLPIRTDLTGNPSFLELLADTRRAALEAYDNQELPFEQLVSGLELSRSPSYSPVYQAVFAMEHEIPALGLHGGLKLELCPLNYHSSKFDITFFIVERGGRLTGSVEYCTRLFQADSILRFIEDYQFLLRHVTEHPNQRLREIPLRSDEDLEALFDS
jgi:amino acid adenylation domain-containing protein